MSTSSRRAPRQATTETAPRWLDAGEQRAWLGYRRMRALLDLELARDLASQSGLSEADYDVLTTLTERADARWRVRELAERLLWSTSRLVHQVTRMERRRLVRREPVPDDARGAIVVLGDHGRAVLEAAAPKHVEAVRRSFVDLLDREELSCLERISAKVIAELSGP